MNFISLSEWYVRAVSLCVGKVKILDVQEYYIVRMCGCESMGTEEFQRNKAFVDDICGVTVSDRLE